MLSNEMVIGIPDIFLAFLFPLADKLEDKLCVSASGGIQRHDS
jgi:hypothetical protein